MKKMELTLSSYSYTDCVVKSYPKQTKFKVIEIWSM